MMIDGDQIVQDNRIVYVNEVGRGAEAEQVQLPL